MTQPTQDARVPPAAPASTAAATNPTASPEPPELDTDQQLGFLYKALDDNQSLIRFLDAKAAFGVALLFGNDRQGSYKFGRLLPTRWATTMVTASCCRVRIRCDVGCGSRCSNRFPDH
jgi:hypothetical protein